MDPQPRRIVPRQALEGDGKISRLPLKDVSVHAMIDLKTLDTPALLRVYAETMAEMKARGVSRGMNNPMADYAEQLVAKFLDAEVLPQSNAGHDLVGRDGHRYEVKARRLSASPSCRQLSALRGLDAQKFDYLVGVLFNEDFTVNRAALIPWEVVMAKSTFVKHTNAWNFILTDDIWSLSGVEDIILEANQARRRIVPAATAISASGRGQDTRDRTKFDLVGAASPRRNIGKGRVILALAQELVRCGVSPQKIEAKLPWARNFLWRSADGIHNSRGFAIAVAGDSIDRFFTTDTELLHFDGRTYAFSTEWTAARFNRARAELAGLSTLHGLAIRESGGEARNSVSHPIS